MTEKRNCFMKELYLRGLIKQETEGLKQHVNSTSRVIYCGFDPTADSLHLGHLVPLLTLRRFQLHGHKPIALVGGATGLIGDPSFKKNERQLNTTEMVALWTEKIKTQLSQFIDFKCGDHSAHVVNNFDWVKDISMLEFLRDTGKHFSVNAMIKKESVRQRIEREETGISFTEFSYMLLQAIDFVELNKRFNCSIQIGGSDQWGNIVGGIDLVRKTLRTQVFGLTTPLVTKSDGTKFGKTESGAIWLDSKKTSPYKFYQFWLNTADADVYKFLNYFSFIPVEEILQIEETDKTSQSRKHAQDMLANELTKLVHGESGLDSARRITQALFSGEILSLSVSDFEQLKLDGIPHSEITSSDLESKSIVQILSEAQMGTGKQIKDALLRQAVKINNQTKDLNSNMEQNVHFSFESALHKRYFLVQVGKKKHHLFERI